MSKEINWKVNFPVILQTYGFNIFYNEPSAMGKTNNAATAVIVQPNNRYLYSISGLELVMTWRYKSCSWRFVVLNVVVLLIPSLIFLMYSCNRDIYYLNIVLFCFAN